MSTVLCAPRHNNASMKGLVCALVEQQYSRKCAFTKLLKRRRIGTLVAVTSPAANRVSTLLEEKSEVGKGWIFPCYIILY